MSTIQELFQQAQLAEAAYADFSQARSLLAALTDDQTGGTFSTAQATAFAARYQVVSQQPNTSSGFSATLFLDKTTNKYIYAVRGTEGFASFDLLVADTGIAINGLAIAQTVDMYNDWQRITHLGVYQAAVVEAQLVETAAYALALAGQFVDAFNMTADAYLQSLNARTDLLIDGGVIYKLSLKPSTEAFTDSRQWGEGVTIASGDLSVAGHSLGGNLAAAFTRLFPDSGASATTINGAGFPTVTNYWGRSPIEFTL